MLLVDADLGLANVDVQLGLDPAHDLGGRARGAVERRWPLRRAHRGRLRHPARPLRLRRPGRAGRRGARPAGGGAARGRGRVATPCCSTSAPGWTPAVRRLAAAADLLLVVATEEPTSLTDAYAVLKLHRRDRPGAAAAGGGQPGQRPRRRGAHLAHAWTGLRPLPRRRRAAGRHRPARSAGAGRDPPPGAAADPPPRLSGGAGCRVAGEGASDRMNTLLRASQPR